jgi:hypothetical protein
MDRLVISRPADVQSEHLAVSRLAKKFTGLAINGLKKIA